MKIRYRYVILDRDSKFDGEVVTFLKATSLNQDFHFGSWSPVSLSQVANCRSSNVDILGTFAARPRLLAPPDVNSAPPKKTKMGKLLLFSHFEKHLSGPHPWSA